MVTRDLYFSRTGVTLTAIRDLPHSKQHGLNRDVIHPQDGHILCDPYLQSAAACASGRAAESRKTQLTGRQKY